MTLENIKKMLDEAYFPVEAQAAMDQIMDVAIARGSISEEEKAQLLAMIDAEIANAEAEANAAEEMATSLEAFAEQIDAALDEANGELEAASADFESEMREAVPEAMTE